MDTLDFVWEQLNHDLDSVRKSISGLTTKTERSETTGGVEAILFANRPLFATGAAAGDFLFITNGRKTGEGAGAGTGVPAYYNAATDTWKRFEDNADVTV